VKIIDQTSCTRLIRGFAVFVADISAYYAEAAAAGQATTCSHLCKFFFYVILARFHSACFSSSSSSLSLSLLGGIPLSTAVSSRALQRVIVGVSAIE
jgi:hypothetical protein